MAREWGKVAFNPDAICYTSVSQVANGTRVRQGGCRSGRYLLHFREPRWQMRRVYVGLTPGGSYLARE